MKMKRMIEMNAIEKITDVLTNESEQKDEEVMSMEEMIRAIYNAIIIKDEGIENEEKDEVIDNEG